MRAAMFCGLLGLSIVLFSSFAAVQAQAADEGATKMSAAEAAEGFESLFDGTSLDQWVGDRSGYVVKDGVMICEGTNFIYSKKAYDDFDLRFDFRVPKDGNNGVGIRAPLPLLGMEHSHEYHPSFQGMEVQILDDPGPKWKDLEDWQLNGALYGIVAPEKGHLKPTGEWNSMEVIAKGPHIQILVNDAKVLDTDLTKVKLPTPDGKDHPGMKAKKGHLVILSHLGDGGDFRNIRVKPLAKKPVAAE